MKFKDITTHSTLDCFGVSSLTLVRSGRDSSVGAWLSEMNLCVRALVDIWDSKLLKIGQRWFLRDLESSMSS